MGKKREDGLNKAIDLAATNLIEAAKVSGADGLHNKAAKAIVEEALSSDPQNVAATTANAKAAYAETIRRAKPLGLVTSGNTRATVYRYEPSQK